MLFHTGRTSGLSIDGEARLQLLDRLQQQHGLMPLIRTSRLSSFEEALRDEEPAREMERSLAVPIESEENSLYIRGDLFALEDHLFYLIFNEAEDDSARMRAGIVYAPETTEPERQLDAFCRRVYEALEAIGVRGVPEDFTQAGAEGVQECTGRDHAAQGDYITEARDPRALQTQAALEALEDSLARPLLHRIEEAQAAGRVAELLADEAENQSLINRLADARLLKREVLVSCRKEGRALFRLPSVEMLTSITASNAVCKACGASLSDEKVEELVALTELASTLLPDRARLASRLRSLLMRIGAPEKSMQLITGSSDGELQMTVTISGERFHFFLRDGEITASHAANALYKLAETEAQHLVVIATGHIQEDARVRLRAHTKVRAPRVSLNEREVVLVEGLEAAAGELQHAFDRASQRALAAELCELDESLGFSAGYMVATRFRLMRRNGVRRDPAEAGALA